MRKPKAAVLIGILAGIGGLSLMATEGRLAAIRTVDIVQLTGVGACFGVAMVAIATMLRSRG